MKSTSLNQPSEATSIINSLVQSSSIMRKTVEHIMVSVSEKDMNPDVELSITPKLNSESSLVVMAPGQSTFKHLPYDTPGKPIKLKLDLVPKECRMYVMLDVLLTESILAEKVDRGIEDTIVEFISKEDTAFFNNLFDAKHLINSNRVKITPENLVSEVERVHERTGVLPAVAYLFTDTDQDISDVLSLMVATLPKSVAINTVPIECLGLDKKENVIIMLPPPEAFGVMYSSMLPTLDVSEEVNHVYSGKRICISVLDSSVMLIQDIKVVSLLC